MSSVARGPPTSNRTLPECPLPPIALISHFPDLSGMRSPASTAARLIAIVLALALAGEGIMRVAIDVHVEWFFYVGMSGLLLGFVPFAPVLVWDTRATPWFRFALAICLLGLVALNCWLLVQINCWDLGWSTGNYTLALPFFYYALGCLAGFLGLRPKTASRR